jgi:hypothetical protein
MSTDTSIQRPTRDIQRPPERLDAPPDHDPMVIRGDQLSRDEKLLTALRAPLASLKDTRAAVNQLIGSTANRAELARAADARMSQVAKSFDAAVPMAEQRRAAVEANIDKVLAGAPDQYATAICAHVKAEGFAAASKLVESGDIRSVRAVLAAPAFLLGMTPEQQGILRTAARAKFCTAEHVLSQELDRAIGTLKRVGEAAMRQVAGAIHTWGAADRDAAAIKKALGT